MRFTEYCTSWTVEILWHLEVTIRKYLCSEKNTFHDSPLKILHVSVRGDTEPNEFGSGLNQALLQPSVTLYYRASFSLNLALQKLKSRVGYPDYLRCLTYQKIVFFVLEMCITKGSFVPYSRIKRRMMSRFHSNFLRINKCNYCVSFEWNNRATYANFIFL